ncbi:hypothetical protein GCM10011500_09950 [Mucilaginibacter rubeus]|nr:hypothetical protein GCM10011500_09950 [Mucilaginibacter rubeus]
MICFTGEQLVLPNYPELVKILAAPISLAVANIMMEDSLRARETERDGLMLLSSDITGVKSKDNLKLVLSRHLEKLLGNSDMMVFALSDDGSLQPFLHAYTSTSSVATGNNVDGETGQRELVKRFFDSSEVNIASIDEIVNDDQFRSIFKDYLQHDVKTIVGIALKNDSRNIGMFSVLLRGGETFTDHQLTLFKEISYQVSKAVLNILAHEVLARRDREKGILLNFSQHVSAARDLDSLLNAMDQHVRLTLGYSHTSINLLHTYHQGLNSLNGLSNVHIGDKAGCQLPGNKDLLDEVMSGTEPRLINLFEKEITGIRLEFPEGHRTSHIMLTRLEVNSEVFGLWVICFGSQPSIDPDYINLVKSIRDTLSLGTRNIILNERIRGREQEKSALLDFSNAVAGVKDKFQLGRIFHNYLKSLCNLDEICLHWLDDKKDIHYCYFWNPESAYADDPDFESVTGEVYSPDDGIINQLLATSAPVHVDINDYGERGDAPLYIKFLKKHGFESIVALPIFKGEDIVAVLLVERYDIDNADQPLFRSLSSQFALAVSDLIATERVVQQLAEINRYKERLEEEKVYLTQELETTHNYAEIVGNSPALNEVFTRISQVSGSESTVLILGETGTGKELIARAIHNDSPRRKNMLVKVNCAALPANLIESELFGHEKGSFTGATERRIGKFELAHGGTLFLDEIGEMPPELQVKLLRALQEKEIERIGGKSTVKTDVRIIAATNRNLEQEIREGRFRNDLYFRISTFPIHLPALRDRVEDIPLLAMYFLKRFAKRAGKVIQNIGSRAMNELMAYNWPGNVRELEHQMERCVLMTNGTTIKEIYLPSSPQPGNKTESPADKFIPGIFDDVERDYIIKTLKYCNGKVSGAGGAAEILGIPASTLTSRMKRLNITKKIVEKRSSGSRS